MTVPPGRHVFADPPLNPGSDQARRLLEHELSKPKYGDRRSLIERFVDWVLARLNDVGEGVGALSMWWLVLILAVLAALIGFGLSRVRRGAGARGQREDEQLLTHETSAQELRDAAARALADGDLAGAYTQYFRALARRGVERTVLAARPGATAREVAAELGRSFPDHASELARAAAGFDAVRYGGRVPDRAMVETMRDLETAVAGSRPARPEPVVAP